MKSLVNTEDSIKYKRKLTLLRICFVKGAVLLIDTTQPLNQSCHPDLNIAKNRPEQGWGNFCKSKAAFQITGNQLGRNLKQQCT